jgi:cytochrome c peroxidase
MRFAHESDHGINAGLLAARNFLDSIKGTAFQPQSAYGTLTDFLEQFPWITYSDLWTLAAVTSIQEMQGPTIPWRPGRADRDVSFCTPDGRLPDPSKESSHLRAIFGRMGFSDQEIVALSGAHALGRCHTDRSGYTGPWTFSPTVLTNDYFKLLVEEKWQWKKWDGPKQFEDTKTKTLMMLPTDMALVKDKRFRPFVEQYARDNDAFFRDFSNVVMKLFELGVPFTTSEEQRFRFKSLNDQET